MKVLEINSRKYKLPSEAEKAKASEQIKKLRKEGEKMVHGMFEFIDAQGGWLDFSYRFFPGEPIRQIRINHGEVVDLPMSLVKHLNNVYKKVRVPGKNLDTDKPIVTKFSRTRFTPVEMM